MLHSFPSSYILFKSSSIGSCGFPSVIIIESSTNPITVMCRLLSPSSDLNIQLFAFDVRALKSLLEMNAYIAGLLAAP